MIPVLFKKNEQQFSSYGLGPIHDIISPKVTRERNGQYLLYFQYPQDAEFADVFEEDMRIKSDAGVRTKWQTFEITRVVRKEGQLIEVFAKHISQSLLKDALNPSVSVRSLNAEQTLRIWNNNRIGDEEFDVWSDISTTNSTNWNIQDVSNAFEALAGVQGSILDVWGGEYEFDNKLIRLHKEMGRKSPVPLEYGRNITGLEQDQQEDNVYTSVYPFATYTAEDDNQPKTVTLPEYYIDGKYLEFHNKRKIQVVDFSGEFESDDIPTVGRLRTLTKNYLNANEIGLPHENLKVEYIDLSKTLDYQEFQTMEEVELNDRLPIFYPKFGITNENAKVVVINYDPVKEENISIELGVIGQSFRTVTTGGLGSRLDRVEKQQDATNNYIVNAKGNRIWFETPNEDMEHKIGDTWFEKNGPYDRIRVWNGNQWETIIDTEDIDKNAKAIAAQQKEIEEAKQTADEAVDRINTDIAGKFTALDEEILAIEGISNSAQANAQTALDQSLDALGNASTALANSQTALNRADTAIGSASDALTKANNAQSAATILSGKVSGFETTVAGFNQTVNNYEGQVSGFRNDILGLESTIASYETKVDEYGNAVSTYATEVSTMRNTVRGFESTVATYGTEVSKLAGEIVGYKNQVSTFNNTVSGLNSTVSKYTTEVNEFGAEVKSYATEVSTLTNTVSGFQSKVSKVEQDYAGISGTVATHTSQISNINGQIALKANTTTVNALTGRVTTAETGITANANAIKLKASQSSVDTLTGRVNTLGAQIDVTAGQISSKVWSTDIQTAVDGIEIGGRNLLLNSYSLEMTGSDSGNRNVSTFEGGVHIITPTNNGNVYNTRVEPSMELVKGHEYTLSFDVLTNTAIGVYWYANINGSAYSGGRVPDTKGEWIKHEFTYTQARDSFNGKFLFGFGGLIAGSEVKYKNLKLEKGNKATDWTPAPEDTDAKISHIETEWTQTFDTFSQTVAGIDGRVTSQKQTIDSISGTVSGHGSRISTVEQTASGLQSTVASKANQSQVTQLSNVWQASVGKLTDFIYNSTFEDGSSLGWEGITVETGYTHSPSKYYGAIRQRDAYFGDLIPIEGGERLNFSIHAWNFTVSPQPFKFGVRYYDKDKNPISWYTAIQSSKGNVLEKHTASWTASARARYVRPWVQISAYSNFTPWFFSQPQISRVPTNAQISMLENNINLRVQKGDLLSQINIEADRQLFQSGKMLFDAENVIFTGKAWIPSSVIGDLEADKITSGTLDAGQITVVNLDALSITTNRAQMVQAGFNAINSSLSVDGNSLTYTHSNGSQTILSAGGLYHREGGTNYQSHYLMEVGTETIDTHDLPITGGRLVTLPSVFRGKPFKVIISIADVLSHELTNYRQFAIQRLVAFPAKDSINHANGTFRIFGYARMLNTNTREIFHSRIQVQYTVIA